MKIYITFGQNHIHYINGEILDKDCVAVFESASFKEGREQAFEFFGQKFSMWATEFDWDGSSMKFFPRGYIHL